MKINCRIFLYGCMQMSLSLAGSFVYGQQTVFGLFESDRKLGEKYYNEKNYHGALGIYLRTTRKDADTDRRIARCYYSLKQYSKSVYYYNRYLDVKHTLPWSDVYIYAEAQTAVGNYPTAIAFYQKYLSSNPDDELVTQKIWRLGNVQYLYEDSAHYAVRKVSFNTDAGELCAVLYKNSVVFMSNRKGPEVIEQVNAALDAPFYRMYKARILSGTDSAGINSYDKVSPLDIGIASNFNIGPVAFYHNMEKMVFVSTGKERAAGGKKNLQLHFAERRKGKWTLAKSFPYNSQYHSVSDPAISDDGKVLYFSSDMGGGFGGRDLYRSTLVNDVWTPPQNLGQTINTPYDEVFPFVHQGHTLYFSSNGLAGLGGLDIFQSAILPDGFSEPRNEGYPINTRYDDFALVLDSLETRGYFSSNRGHGGYNDDVYEFDMDLQKYPLTLEGIVRYKEHAWSDSTSIRAMPQAKVYVYDNLRRVTVYETVTKNTGRFSVVVPYFSEYTVHITGSDGKKHSVVLEIPRHQKQLSVHEIVIIKDFFQEK